jgi:hypothetical protein
MHCRGSIQDWQQMPFRAEKLFHVNVGSLWHMAVENVLPSSLKFCPYVFPGSNRGQRDPLVFQFATTVKICTKSYQQFSSLFKPREHINISSDLFCERLQEGWKSVLSLPSEFKPAFVIIEIEPFSNAADDLCAGYAKPKVLSK